MYKSTGFDIDVTNSISNPGYLFTDSGTISAVGIVGNIGPLVTSYDCNGLDGVQPINFFIEAYTQQLTPYYGNDYNTDDNCIPGTHIGGVLVECIDCEISVIDILQRDDECTEYKRKFTSAFGVGFSKISNIDICIEGNSYSSGFGCGFDTGDTSCECGIFDGNPETYDGNQYLYDGNCE